MNTEEFSKSKLFKIVFPILIIVLIIALWQKGYGFGQWLHSVLQ